MAGHGIDDRSSYLGRGIRHHIQPPIQWVPVALSSGGKQKLLLKLHMAPK